MYTFKLITNVEAYQPYKLSRMERMPFHYEFSRKHKLTRYTLNPSILRVGTISSVEIMWAVNQSGLSCCTGNIIKSYDDRCILSKTCTAISSCI